MLAYWKPIVLVLAILGLIGYGYMKGIENERLKTLKDSADALRSRGDINQTIRNMDDYHACITVGGLPDECAELRRMGEESETK